ncbi:PilX N-terminal domain-containing pilus assembly protein [Kinneretia aquatilis]|nr:PilX N-terminal domain-containing pilus assembly protein [Paucibacter aquatile]
MLSTPSHGQDTQVGAATLVVVMVLFLVMAMVAAFANRNLIFEQRIASNYYRGSVAMEAADAGVAWTEAQLNGLNVDAACQPTMAAGANRFRDRYLSVDPNTQKLQVSIPPASNTVYFADCSLVAGQGWQCRCPGMGAWTVNAGVAAASAMQPNFRIQLMNQTRADARRPGTIRILSRACSSSGTTSLANGVVQSDCDNELARREKQLGSNWIETDFGFVSALKMPPAAPLTLAGGVASGAAGLGLHNSSPSSSGILLVAGGSAAGLDNSRLDSIPGTPGHLAVITNDSTLAATSATPGRFFSMHFGMSMNSYINQPAMRQVICPAAPGDCAAILLGEYNRGVRMAWVIGPMALSSNITLGTAASPMLVVVMGGLQLSGPMQLTGLFYATGDVTWASPIGQLSLLNGALMSEGNLTVSGNVDIWYQAGIIDALKNRTGSFVRLPGSWWN